MVTPSAGADRPRVGASADRRPAWPASRPRPRWSRTGCRDHVADVCSGDLLGHLGEPPAVNAHFSEEGVVLRGSSSGDAEGQHPLQHHRHHDQAVGRLVRDGARTDVARPAAAEGGIGATQGRGPPEGRRVRGAAGKRPRRDSLLGYWLMPMPTIDPVVVRRSAAAREDYGPEFTYTHYAGFRSLPVRRGAIIGVRRLVRGHAGPTAAQASCSRGCRRGRARARRARVARGSRWTSSARAAASGASRRWRRAIPATTRPRRCSPSPRCASPSTTTRRPSGQVTTAEAMGETLLDRLSKSGISFTVEYNRP